MSNYFVATASAEARWVDLKEKWGPIKPSTFLGNVGWELTRSSPELLHPHIFYISCVTESTWRLVISQAVVSSHLNTEAQWQPICCFRKKTAWGSIKMALPSLSQWASCSFSETKWVSNPAEGTVYAATQFTLCQWRGMVLVLGSF